MGEETSPRPSLTLPPTAELRSFPCGHPKAGKELGGSYVCAISKGGAPGLWDCAPPRRQADRAWLNIGFNWALEGGIPVADRLECFAFFPN